MKKLLFFVVLIFVSLASGFAQQNMSLLGQLSYSEDCSDIWGWKAPNGPEYALVGVRNGVSIVSLQDPSNPTEVEFVAGASSTWRDLKTFGNYAYITNETSGGILVIDLSTIGSPSFTFNYYLPVVDNQAMESAHNIYIDEFGYAYVCGAGPLSGGVIIFDLNADPWSPPQVGSGPAIYAHDVYARDNILYTSDVYAGVFSIYDVSDKANITFLGSNPTPFTFTHNAWISDDSKTIFTTDERGNAPVAAYDITDYTDILYLDEIRPPATVDRGVIPHNAHVLNDYVITSYYTDGVVIFDGNRPSNLVQVGQYDTFGGGDGGFSGCWGAYPFLPSGIVLASDINTGLYVLGTNYIRACYLEGNITDAADSSPLNNAVIEILSTPAQDVSATDGTYATGLADAGTYQVEVSKPGYVAQTLPATLTNGQVTILDVALVKLPTFQFAGIVKDVATGLPVPSAVVNIYNEDFNFDVTTNMNGQFTVNNFISDTYQIYGGKWGYKTTEISNNTITNSGNPFEIFIEKGIEDVFELDLGWTVTSNANTGDWVREEPIGTSQGGNPANTDSDINTDVGSKCYVTGNGGGSGGDDDVDGGTTTLTSPVFDLSGMTTPEISYFLWFVNVGGGSTPNDQLEVRISNGMTTVTLETLTTSLSSWRSETVIEVAQIITPTANMQLIVETYDLNGGHIVEGGFDYFQAYDAALTSSKDIKEELFSLQINPNPSNSTFLVSYDIEKAVQPNTQLEVTNLLGQVLEVKEIQSNTNQISIGNKLGAGVYFVQITSPEGRSLPYKIIKTE